MHVHSSLKLVLLLTLTTCFFFPSAAFGQSKLATAVKKLADDPALKSGSLGLIVMDAASGRVLAQNEADKTIIPASIQKVLTTATALGVLGEDYVFETYLQYDGQIDAKGVLRGNLYIAGTGDPTLGSPDMENTIGLEGLVSRFLAAVQRKGIKRIEGHIVGDGSYFATAVGAPSWQWADLGNYYASGAWGLNIHENFYYLRFQQTTRLGATPPIVEIEPAVAGLSFKNEVTSASRGSGDNAYIYGAPYTYNRYVRGTIPVGSSLFSIKGSIPDPPLFAAQVLEEALNAAGITCRFNAASIEDLNVTDAPSRKLLYTHRSPSLANIIDRANKKSVNLYCESLLKTIGKVVSGEGSFKAGIAVAESFWQNKGLSTQGVFIADGSGLSPRNGLTARFLAQVLRLSAKDPSISAALTASLPLAGKSGNLQSKFRGTAAENKLWAKSGTLNRVRSYAGYATTADGKQVAFVVAANNYIGSGGAMRRKLDNFLLSLF